MLKWIWTYIRKYRFLMALGLSLSVVVAAANMINPLITGRIVDRVITGGEYSILLKNNFFFIIFITTDHV